MRHQFSSKTRVCTTMHALGTVCECALQPCMAGFFHVNVKDLQLRSEYDVQVLCGRVCSVECWCSGVNVVFGGRGVQARWGTGGLTNSHFQNDGLYTHHKVVSSAVV
jgi:hypothetical protein